MVEITPTLSLEDNELRFDFIRASGPGGQNVNKVASAIKLYFDVRQSPSLPDEVKKKVVALLRDKKLRADLYDEVGRERVLREYSAGRMVERTLEIYQEALR